MTVMAVDVTLLIYTLYRLGTGTNRVRPVAELNGEGDGDRQGNRQARETVRNRQTDRGTVK